MPELRKVKPGDPAVIPAETFNVILDSARDFLERQRSVKARPPSFASDPCIVWVRNDSGEDVGRFGVLGIDAPIFDPTDADALPAFHERVLISGVLPAESGRFVITMEPIADGAWGRAWISGTCLVKVVADGDTSAADIAAGETGYLSGGSGAAQVLWRAAGSGEQWAIVRIGGGGGGSARPIVISNCTTSVAGVVKVKLSTAPGSSTAAEGATEEYAWLGTDAFATTGMALWALPISEALGGLTLSWLVLDLIQGAAHWAEPASGDLWTTQDNPSAATLCDG